LEHLESEKRREWTGEWVGVSERAGERGYGTADERR
jgi:hypothetical protein